MIMQINNRAVIRKAYGKVNLFLKVGGLREDGKHEVVTVLHKTECHDTVKIEISSGSGIEIICGNKDVPCDERNLCYRAAELYLREAGKDIRVTITIDKNIPVKAGMGGGSSDCAAVLLALDEMLCCLGFEENLKLAESLGSDVPFFMYDDKAMLGLGSGEQMIGCNSAIKNVYGLFVVCGEKESTGKAYASLDEKKKQLCIPIKDCMQSCADAVIEALSNGDNEALYASIENDFELSNYQIDGMRTMLMKNGARKVFLCGSGPTVCGIFESEEGVKKAVDIVSYPTFVSKFKA